MLKLILWKYTLFYRKYLLRLLCIEDKPMICRTNYAALYDTAHSSTQVLDKMLIIETAIIGKMLEQRVMHKLEWIPCLN